MKSTKIAILTLALTVSTIVSSVKAQEVRTTPQVAIRNAQTVLEHQTTPFNLVSDRAGIDSGSQALTGIPQVNLAYRGYFKNIPSYTQLAQAYLFGHVDAANLVRAGVEQGRVSPETLNNKDYLSAVDARLRTLGSNR